MLLSPKGPTALRLAAPVLVCMAALTACGGGGGAHSAPGVASLPSHHARNAASAPGPSTSSSSASAPADDTSAARPQERLDDSPERREALIAAWDQCLVDHGAHWTTSRPGVAGAPKSVADPVPKAAHQACENKLPLGPPELNPALNPHYRDGMMAEVSCLRAHGVMVHLTQDTSVYPNGLGWTYDSSTTKVPDDEGRIEDDCQEKAFAGTKEK